MTTWKQLRKAVAMVEVTFEEHQADLAKELETIGLLEAVMKRLSEINVTFDSEWGGYYVSGCDYWCEIEWEDKE